MLHWISDRLFPLPEVLPPLVWIIVGVLGLLSSLQQNFFAELEVKHPILVRFGGAVLSLGIIAAGISDYQQRNQQVTKADLEKLPDVQYIDERLKGLGDHIGKKVEKIPSLSMAGLYQFQLEDFKFILNTITLSPGNNSMKMSGNETLSLNIKNITNKSVQNYFVYLGSTDCGVISSDVRWEGAKWEHEKMLSYFESKPLSPNVSRLLPDARLDCKKSGVISIDVGIQVGDSKPMYYRVPILIAP